MTRDRCSKNEKNLKFICFESFRDEINEDECMDILDLYFTELNKNGKTGKICYKSLAKASFTVRVCFPREQEKDVLMKEIGEIRVSRES